MNISYHTWHPGGVGVLAVDNESGYAVAVSSETTWIANRNLADMRLRTAAVLREERDERDATIRRMTSMLAAASKACDVMEDIGEQASKRIAELEQRQQGHLALIVKLTNETLFADEIAGWKEQRAKMIAEIGTLKARIAELEPC